MKTESTSQAPIRKIEDSPSGFVQHVGWMRHDADEEVMRLLRQGQFEGPEQAFFWLYLRSGDIFIDCGAHLGLYSIIASKATNHEGIIVSVEANSNTADHLEFNLQTNGVANFKIVCAAVWDSPTTIRFLDGEQGDAAYDHVAFDNGKEGKLVQTTTLSMLVESLSFDQVALVKIDVEGAEPEALRGAKEVIEKGLLPVLMIEFTENNLTRRGLDTGTLYRSVEELGYTLCEFDPVQKKLVAYPFDGPIWYKNLFACADLSKVNERLLSASDANIKIANDIAARASACAPFKELENLKRLREEAASAVEFRLWAERTEKMLSDERGKSETLQLILRKVEDELQVERALKAEQDSSLQRVKSEHVSELRRAKSEHISELHKAENEHICALLNLENEIKKFEIEIAIARTALSESQTLAAERLLWAERSDIALEIARTDHQTLSEKIELEVGTTQRLRALLESRRELLLRLISKRRRND